MHLLVQLFWDISVSNSTKWTVHAQTLYTTKKQIVEDLWCTWAGIFTLTFEEGLGMIGASELVRSIGFDKVTAFLFWQLRIYEDKLLGLFC